GRDVDEPAHHELVGRGLDDGAVDDEGLAGGGLDRPYERAGRDRAARLSHGRQTGERQVVLDIPPVLLGAGRLLQLREDLESGLHVGLSPGRYPGDDVRKCWLVKRGQSTLQRGTTTDAICPTPIVRIPGLSPRPAAFRRGSAPPR